MVKRAITTLISGVLTAFVLSSCSTTGSKPISPGTLIKLPEKKIVHLPSPEIATKVEKEKIINEALKAELKLIEPTVEPIWQPPVIAKVLVFPYVDNDGVLHAGQYLYVKLKNGRWLYGEYLFRKPSKVFDPLSWTSVYQPKSSGKANVSRSKITGSSSGSGSFFTGGKPKYSHPASLMPPSSYSGSGGNSIAEERWQKALQSLGH